MTDCVNALKEWTGKTRTCVLYDSTVDEFTDDGLFNKVKRLRNIALIGFTTDGDVFGAFYSNGEWEQNKKCWSRNIFVFSFESHGRCKTPQKFSVKEGTKDKPYVYFWKDNTCGFLSFFVGSASGFWLGNDRSSSYCINLSKGFADLEDTTLTGQMFPSRHQYTRLVAVQLS